MNRTLRARFLRLENVLLALIDNTFSAQYYAEISTTISQRTQISSTAWGWSTNLFPTLEERKRYVQNRAFSIEMSR